jgi:hypothetical protein
VFDMPNVNQSPVQEGDLGAKDCVYAGNIWKRGKRYCVRFQYGGKIVIHSTFDTTEEAREFQINVSDHYGLTTVRYLSYYERGLEIPKEIKQMCCGFVDGDGYLSITKDHQAVVSISQSCDSQEPSELVFIRSYYGGVLFLNRKAMGNKRQKWVLDIKRRTQLLPFLKDIVEYCMLQSAHAIVILQWLHSDRKNLKDVANSLKNMHTLAYYQQIKIDETRITHPYIGGLFGADGCCVVNPDGYSVSVRSCIAQVKSPALLRSIQSFFGFGSIAKDMKYWICCGTNAITFLQEIRPYCFGQKVPQIDLLVDWVLWDDRDFARKNREYVKRKCSKLKRT